jgi:hypothetical protein
MPKFNGEGLYYCKNCGVGRGVHRATDMACPRNGEDQTGLNPQIYMDTKFESQGWQEKEELAGQKFKTLEGRTLFDDYFLAALTGVSTIFGTNGLTQEDVEELFPDLVITCAFDVAKAAMKKREEYFAGKVNKDE